MKKIYSFLSLILFSISIVYAQTPNYNITLAANLPYSTQSLSNIWHYVDELGNEYALVGARDGISIVNVTNPSSPVQVTQLAGPSSTWREIRTYGDYAYITTEDGNVGLQILDLNPLPAAPTVANMVSWMPTINGDQLSTIHALHIDAGRVYLYGSNVGAGGALIMDLTSTPMAPVYLGRWNVNYIHDGCVRNNNLYGGHIYDGWFSIIDVSNPASIPTSVPTQSTPGNFTHNTWLATTNDDTIYTTDEVGNSYLTSYDISNPGNIKELDRTQSQNPGSGSVVHNTYIVNKNGTDFAVTSWYKDGVVITDVGRPWNMVNVAWYDTYTQGQGGGFSGAWGVDAFLPSGNLVVSDINNGLFVLAPTYTRACYLEGTITDFVTGLPINAASVVMSSINITDASIASGFYGTGYAIAGTYSVTYSKPGYVPQTMNVSLTNGVVTIQNVQLVPLATIAMSGQVIQSWDNAGIPNARVRIWNSTFTFDTITDALGNFTIPAGYAGVYEVIGGKWLFETNCIANQNITSSSGPIIIPLDSGIYDDFTFDFLWMRTGTATAGLWERGEPLGTTFATANDANPDADVTADCYQNAYVTGNTGQSASDDDVDGGFTMITSPIFSLVGYQNPKMQYSRWFFNSGGFGNPNDSMRIQINNGTTTVTLETITPSSGPQSQWINKIYYLNSVIPFTSTMTVRVRAIDLTPGHLVEGGFDHFRITDSISSGFDEIDQNVNQLVVYPNPFVDETGIIYAFHSGFKSGELIVRDMSGRIVQTFIVTSVGGELKLRKDLAAGSYMIEAREDGNLLLSPIKIIKTR